MTTAPPMIRARFYVADEDYRPVKWPIKHPYWCSGATDTHSILVAYADNIEEILENWPDAERIEFSEAEAYEFTDRFPKPTWFGQS